LWIYSKEHAIGDLLMAANPENRNDDTSFAGTFGISFTEIPHCLNDIWNGELTGDEVECLDVIKLLALFAKDEGFEKKDTRKILIEWKSRNKHICDLGDILVAKTVNKAYSSKQHFSCKLAQSIQVVIVKGLCDKDVCEWPAVMEKRGVEESAPDDSTSENLEIPPPVYEPEIVNRALEIMKHGDPMSMMVTTTGKFHVSDVDGVKVFFCCKGAQHVRNSRGLHPKISGESGSGKTDMMMAGLHLLTPECFIKTGMSSKAIFYHQLPPQLIIYLDDYKENEDMDSIIKQTSGAFHEPYVHRTVADHKAQTVIAPSEIVWAITSVNSMTDDQLVNRQFGTDADDSIGTTEKVITGMIKDAKSGTAQREVTKDVLVCRAMSQMLQGKMFTVKLPEEWDLQWTDMSNRRNPSFFLDILYAHTVWRFMQRKTDDENVLIADIQDFNDAKAIYDNRGTAMKDKLTDKERELALLLVKMHGVLYLDEAALKLVLSRQRVSVLANGIKGKGGLANKLPGFSYEKVMISDGDDQGNKKRFKIEMRLTGFNGIEIFDKGVVTLKI
jgi:hypothetical protein